MKREYILEVEILKKRELDIWHICEVNNIMTTSHPNEFKENLTL
jgi:hypothetical protein